MRKWIHRFLKGASLTTALFIFQACYGTPPTGFEDAVSEPETEQVDEKDAQDSDLLSGGESVDPE